MRIYLAARWNKMHEMAEIGDKLEALGHDVTARWIRNAEAGQTRTENALMDMEDVEDADVLVCYTEARGTPVPGGGRHTEFGMAAAMNKQLCIVGPREQIFHWLPGVSVFANTDEMLAYFAPSDGLPPANAV